MPQGGGSGVGYWGWALRCGVELVVRFGTFVAVVWEEVRFLPKDELYFPWLLQGADGGGDGAGCDGDGRTVVRMGEFIDDAEHVFDGCSWGGEGDREDVDIHLVLVVQVRRHLVL